MNEDILAKISRLSPSALGKFLACPKQFEFTYVQGLKSPPNSRMLMGTAMHRAIQYGYLIKKQTAGAQPRLKDMVDELDAAWVKEKVAAEPLGLTWPVSEAELVDAAHALLRLYHLEVMPRYFASGVEEFHKTKIAGLDYVGYLDLPLMPEAGVNRFVDLKFRSKTVSQKLADKDIQITTYAFLQSAGRGTPAVGEFHELLMQATPRINIIKTRREQKDYDFLVHQVETTLRLIRKAGEFIPNTTHWGCGEYDESNGKGCYFWKLCHMPKGF